MYNNLTTTPMTDLELRRDSVHISHPNLHNPLMGFSFPQPMTVGTALSNISACSVNTVSAPTSLSQSTPMNNINAPTSLGQSLPMNNFNTPTSSTQHSSIRENTIYPVTGQSQHQGHSKFRTATTQSWYSTPDLTVTSTPRPIKRRATSSGYTTFGLGGHLGIGGLNSAMGSSFDSFPWQQSIYEAPPKAES